MKTGSKPCFGGFSWPPKSRAAILTGKHFYSFSVGMDVTGPKMETVSNST